MHKMLECSYRQRLNWCWPRSGSYVGYCKSFTTSVCSYRNACRSTTMAQVISIHEHYSSTSQTGVTHACFMLIIRWNAWTELMWCMNSWLTLARYHDIWDLASTISYKGWLWLNNNNFVNQIHSFIMYDLISSSTRSIWKLRDGFPTWEQFPPFEEDSYIFPTHKRGYILCQEGMLYVNAPCEVSHVITKQGNNALFLEICYDHNVGIHLSLITLISHT